MDDKLKQEVYDLINKTQAEMNAGNLNSANATMDAAKDKIKLPVGGGITGPVTHSK